MRTRGGAAHRGVAMLLNWPSAAAAAQRATGPRTTDRRRVPFAMGSTTGPGDPWRDRDPEAPSTCPRPLSRLSASSRDPRVTVAVRCSGLGDRLSDVRSGRPRLGAIIVPLSATAEAGGGGAPGPAEAAWPSRAAWGAASPPAAGEGPASRRSLIWWVLPSQPAGPTTRWKTRKQQPPSPRARPCRPHHPCCGPVASVHRRAPRTDQRPCSGPWRLSDRPWC